VLFHPLVFCDLAFKPHLVGALVEPLDSPVLELTLFKQVIHGEEEEDEKEQEQTCWVEKQSVGPNCSMWSA
jgi:hypothetical protein